MANWKTRVSSALNPVGVPKPNHPQRGPTNARSEWTKGVCPICGYADADVDAEGVLWCPACGYSKKGCYT